MTKLHHTSRLDAHLSFDVAGHLVEFDWFQFWGYGIVKVDGKEVLKEHHNFSTGLVRTYTTQIGDHEITIEKHRPAMFAGFRKQPLRVLEDGVRRDVPGTI